MQGMVFQGERVPIWNPQQGIYRPKILRAFGAAITIQTSFNSPYDDRQSGPNGTLFYRYQGTDPNLPNNVALRRAMELTRPLLYLVAVEPGLFEPIFPCYVVGEQPENYAFAILADPGTLPVFAEEGAAIADVARKEYATREVLQRLHQRRFSYSVIEAYAVRCAVCRIHHRRLLDGAHILPDRDESSLPEVRNGLALCKIHHAAYDANILGISPDRTVQIREDVLEERDGPMLMYGFQAMHGTMIHVPRASAKQPNPDYLAARFKKFLAA
jgi:putative restriction endonuclease